jgi:hypothetical protein
MSQSIAGLKKHGPLLASCIFEQVRATGLFRPHSWDRRCRELGHSVFLKIILLNLARKTDPLSLDRMIMRFLWSGRTY